MAQATKTRRIVQTFEGQTEHDGGLGQWSSDAQCLAMCADLNASATAAWYLWKEAHGNEQCDGCEHHPRLTVTILAEGLDVRPYQKIYSPTADAGTRYQRRQAPPTDARVWRYSAAAGRMLRGRQPAPWSTTTKHQPTTLATALESITAHVDHVHTHHPAGSHCPTCPTPHRPHPSEGQDQGARGQGQPDPAPSTKEQLHRVKLWTPTGGRS